MSIKIILALYENWKMADAVVEMLLDQGFSHTNIFLSSGDAWQNEVRSNGGSLIADPDLPYKPGQEVLVKVRAHGGELARIALERIFRSRPPLTMLKRSEERPEASVVAFMQSIYMHRHIH